MRRSSPFPTRANVGCGLRRLEQALEEQRVAVADFRAQIAGLNTAMSGLGESAQMLKTNLDAAAQDTARAQAEALRLQATAEAMARLA